MKIFDVIDAEIYGESHSPEIGVVVRGIPDGTVIDTAAVQRFADRRKSGKYLFSTPRREADEIVWDSGLNALPDGRYEVCGDIKAHIVNADIRPADYSYLVTPRPSHADYVSTVRDGGSAAASGGGRFSGRMTAPLTIAGGIAEQMLAERGIYVKAYIGELAGVKGRGYGDGLPSLEEIDECLNRPLPMLSETERAAKAATAAAKEGDSVGGVAECIVYGMPAGIGDSLFGGLESKISAAVYAVPAVKGVEFGAGFAISAMRGSTANDPFAMKDGKVVTLSNNSGGINGGISNGMPVTLRAAFRPTPSISLPQRTVNLADGTETVISVKGRHDVTFVPRALAAVESATALAVLDEILKAEISLKGIAENDTHNKNNKI